MEILGAMIENENTEEESKHSTKIKEERKNSVEIRRRKKNLVNADEDEEGRREAESSRFKCYLTHFSAQIQKTKKNFKNPL